MFQNFAERLSVVVSFSILYFAFLLCTFIGCSCFLAEPAYALKTIWSVDKERSSVQFKIKHMMVKTVSGQFKDFFGTVDYDGTNIDQANLAAEIQTASIDTADSKRDKHLRTKDFFDASTFPTISYKSTKIVQDSKGAFRIFGTLTMHGISHSVTLQATALQAVEEKAEDINSGISGDAYAQVKFSHGDAHSNSNNAVDVRRLSTTATTSLDRKDFGISMGAMDRGGTLIGDQVKIILEIQLTPVRID